MTTTYYNAVAVDGETPKPNNLIVFNDTDYGCRIIRNADDTFTVNWTDYVANEWTETYEDLSVALLRMAMLAACKELNWDCGFITTTQEQHLEAAQEFFNQTIG